MKLLLDYVYCKVVKPSFLFQNEEESPRSDQELASMAVAREQDGYVMVDMAEIVRLPKWLLLYQSEEVH